MQAHRTERAGSALHSLASRRAALRRLGSLAAVLLRGVDLSQDAAAQHASTASAAATEIGNAPPGRVALEIIAKIAQQGSKFSFYGYLTAISGLAEATLFATSNPAVRTAAGARFTFVGAATLAARSVVQPLFVVDAEGSLTIYFNEAGGANFGNGQGFSSGLPIAVLSLRFQSIINVLAPKQGLFTGFGELTQVAATPFTLAGRLWRLGHPGLTARLSATGQGTLLDPALPRATIVSAGNVVVTGTTSGG